MKNALLTVLLFFGFFVNLKAKSDMTPTMMACRSISIMLNEDFIRNKISLPTSWEEIPTLREIKENAQSQNIKSLKSFNDLAMVPNAPIIKPDSLIPRNRWGWRLFVISRKQSLDYAQSNSTKDTLNGGRFLIIISPDNDDSLPCWISEIEAQAILKQLNNFNPELQPFAFENIDQLIEDNIKLKDEMNKSVSEQLRTTGKPNSENHTKTKLQYSRRQMLYILGSIFGILFTVLLFILVARFRLLK